MEVNGKTCFNKVLTGGQGKQVCGSNNNGWHEDSMKVTCTGDAVDGKFTVRVYTTLNSAGNDESFGIDNVMMMKAKDDSGGGGGNGNGGGSSGKMTATFDNGDMQGWSCDKITTCGSLGKICGGYNTKAKSHEIKKTYKVDPGKYTIIFDFIKIDSW